MRLRNELGVFYQDEDFAALYPQRGQPAQAPWRLAMILVMQYLETAQYLRVNDFSCTVKTWDGEYTVGLQHLKSYNYLPAECEQMREICDRINRVYSSGLEESVQKFLDMLGKPKRAYLTPLEEKVLSLLELEIIP
ncbi:MAG: hypothetical protein V7K66_21400 [Nostoc sp.]